MSATNKPSGGNLLLWVGLAMIVSSLVLALVSSVYVGRAGGYPGPGGMMGPGGMKGQGYGAPGWGAAGEVGSLSEAREAVERSLQSYGNSNLEVVEVMEFANNYYAEVREKDTGIGAMELLVDKPGGTVYPEPGPNMMWNTKYGMMSGGGYGPMMGPGRGMMGPNGGGMMGGSSASASARGPRGNTAARMDVSPEQARKIAEAYLSRVSPSTETEKPERFYGYYTVDTEKDGKAVGMLSVNGYSGEVWYHSWHGPFIAKQEGTRALIHPSAWNRNSREFRYEILNTRARNFRDRNFSAPTISIQVLRGPSRLQGLRSSPRLTTERGAPVDSGMPAHRLRPDNRYLFVRPDSGKMHHQVVERGYEEALKT